jgi:hypothetical protein
MIMSAAALPILASTAVIMGIWRLQRPLSHDHVFGFARARPSDGGAMIAVTPSA